MSDLIRRQDAIKDVESLPNCYNGFSDTYDKACFIRLLEEVPATSTCDFWDSESNSCALYRPSAQPEPRWIPCSEAVPATEDKVLCQTITKKGVVNFVIGYHTETFGWACGMNSNVVAWMPLPDPYREEGEANE